MTLVEGKLAQYGEIIQEALNSALADFSTGRQEIVYQAMRYSLMAGGKRLRPILTLEFCKIFGGNIDAAIPFALAVEMIHGYSLIHDDLPCMDDDDYRRGQLSCHKKFGEANALLAGDALLTEAFGQIGKAKLLPTDVCVKAVALLSERAGAAGMVGGQVIDLAYEGKKLTEEILINMYRLKTGALLRVACELGVLAGNGGDIALKKAGQYAEALGLAFQIVDDILDVTGNQEVLGKPIGSDQESQKTTFVTLYGVEKAKKIAAKYTEEAKKIAAEFPNNVFLLELTKYLLERDH